MKNELNKTKKNGLDTISTGCGKLNNLFLLEFQNYCENSVRVNNNKRFEIRKSDRRKNFKQIEFD